ncbi:hypothetical protein BT63DRAFT_480486 [Microthyrium microscopicum]|uniref:DUF7136 domain-containing protein n=1 Tax=Microthyrium microscopicum TaxID=703497 RepID=A0A6A6U7X7_9PEZI|nr:hypothetical protein BT63DRAFT_480486 [Microthyrium microscopicum]
MARPKLHLIALIFFSIISTILAQNDTKVQLDLVFPKNNSVYKPVFPFPVVFAVHNAALSWPYRVLFWWDLIAMDIDGHEPLLLPIIASGGYDPHWPLDSRTFSRGAAPPSPFLLINSTSQMVNTTSQSFMLQYRFGLWNNCSVIRKEMKDNYASKNSIYDISGEVYFNVSREHGDTPNISSGGKCATPLGAIGILNRTADEEGWACPDLQSPPPKPDSCAFIVNDSVANAVATAMVSEMECMQKETWPNFTGIVGKCFGKEMVGGASMILPATITALIILLGLGIPLVIS